MSKSPSLAARLRDFASKIGASTMTVDNTKNPNSALNRMKNQPKQSLSWQARGVQQNLANTNPKGQTYGIGVR